MTERDSPQAVIRRSIGGEIQRVLAEALVSLDRMVLSVWRRSSGPIPARRCFAP